MTPSPLASASLHSPWLLQPPPGHSAMVAQSHVIKHLRRKHRLSEHTITASPCPFPRYSTFMMKLTATEYRVAGTVALAWPAGEARIRTPRATTSIIPAHAWAGLTEVHALLR